MSDELKPCAHCAKTGIEVEQRRGDFHEWSIECSGCYCRTDWYTSPEQAIAAWNARADDAPISEKPVPSLKESTEDTQALSDSQEKLEADIHSVVFEWGDTHYDFPYVFCVEVFNSIDEWLDRQAAITERELCGRCSPYATAKDYLDTIDSLTAERDKLDEDCSALDKRCIALEERVDSLTAERDELKAEVEAQRKRANDAERGVLSEEWYVCRDRYEDDIAELTAERDELRKELKLARAGRAVRVGQRAAARHVQHAPRERGGLEDDRGAV